MGNYSTRRYESESSEYSAWTSMKQRCNNPDHTCYESYGGRGISVCKEWMNSYYTFLKDMGRRPTSAHSLDRINNDGNYEPSNCRWATRREQHGNKRNNVILTHNGMSLNVAQWSRYTGIPDNVLRARLRNGWDAHNTLTALPTRKKPHVMIRK